MPEVIIVEMTADHICMLAELEKLCFSVPWSVDSIEALLYKPNAHVYVAELDGQAIAYAGMDQILDEGYINNICTHPKYRNIGVASELMRTLLKYGKENKLSFLTLEVRASNKIAMAFYTKFGFTSEGIRKNYYSRPTENALIMFYRYY